MAIDWWEIDYQHWAEPVRRNTHMLPDLIIQKRRKWVYSGNPTKKNQSGVQVSAGQHLTTHASGLAGPPAGGTAWVFDAR